MKDALIEADPGRLGCDPQEAERADVEFTRALERGEIANDAFHHASHLRVAWVYLSESATIGQASAQMSATLRRFAASAGKPEKYHETITQFWIRLLGAMRHSLPAHSLSRILDLSPRLLEKDFSMEYYSPERFFSDAARSTWIEPDLKPLPNHAVAICSSGPEGNS